MNIEQDERLAELEFLSGSYEPADAFSELYESMLYNAKACEDFVTMRAIQQLLLQQFMFLFHMWRVEKGYLPSNAEEIR